MRTMLKSKIHRACVTDVNIYYEGSITIDKKLMKAADILPYEQVQVLNINNGARFNTYAIEGESDEICLTGTAARLAVKGDVVLIFSYSLVEDAEATNFRPKIIHVNAKTVVTENKRGHLVFA